jgi:hypothetical protein
MEGGWGEGCAHRYRGIDQARTQDFFWGVPSSTEGARIEAPKARESRRRRRENRGAEGADGGGVRKGVPLPAEKFLYFKHENGAFLMGLE